MNKKQGRKGFTLIELLVVILILAILAALIVPKLLSRQSDAKKVKAQADIKTMSDALQLFRLDNDRLPTTEEGLQALRTQPNDTPNWKPYLQKDIPLDPWQHEYVYQQTGDDTFIIKSLGRDGAEGGQDEDADITEGDSNGS